MVIGHAGAGVPRRLRDEARGDGVKQFPFYSTVRDLNRRPVVNRRHP